MALPSTKLTEAAARCGWNDHTMLCTAMNFLDHAVDESVREAFLAYVNESVSAEFDEGTGDDS